MFDGEERLNPFPGLRAFEPDEDHLFFGRESQIDELLGRLRRNRFLSVVGTSGSGKSSLIRSGMIPSLYSGFMARAGSSWRVAVMRPGSDPIGNLAQALNEPEVLGGEDEEFAEMNRALIETTLSRSARGLVDCVRQARLPEGENLLVLADQFEELFRFKQNARIRGSKDSALAFVKLLLEAGQQEEVPIYVVLTMRSDFIGNCTEFPGLAEAVNDGQYLVPRMTREERKAAIVGPVAVGGAEISPRLVLRLLNDVGDNPDQLPILQHALMRTWDYWEDHHADGEPVDLKHYEATGTMAEALSQHAEEAYRELDSPAEQKIAELLFKALTDAGSDARGVRRPCPLSEICALTGATEAEVIAVIERFRAPGRTFLMPPASVPLDADSIIDISHESLMRTWKRLIEWVEEETRSAQLYQHLSKSAGYYQEGKAGLFRDPELQIALNWREKNAPTETWAQRYDPAFERAMLFLKYSEKERDLEIAEKERRRRKQLLRARRLAIGMAAVGLVILLFGIQSYLLKLEADRQEELARINADRAEQQAQEALRQKEVAQQQQAIALEEKAEADRQRQEALRQQQIADEERRRALEQERKAQAEKRRAEEAQRAAEVAEAEAEAQHAKALEQKELAEQARRQAEASEEEARRLRMIDLGRTLALQTRRLEDERAEVAALLARQAHRLNVEHGGDPEEASIFDALRSSLGRLDSGRDGASRATVFRFNRDAVRSLALAADGRTLAVGSDDGTVSLVDLADAAAGPGWSAETGSEVRAVALAAGRLAAGGFDGSIRVWDTDRPRQPPRVLAHHAATVHALAFAPGGGRLASGGAGGEVVLWDLAAGESAAVLAAPAAVLTAPGKVMALAFEPAGRRLAAATPGGILLFDLADTTAPGDVLDAERDVRSIAFGAAGETLAGGTARGPIALWDLRPSPPARTRELPGHVAAVTGLSFAGDLLASSSLDGHVKLWDVSRPDAEPLAISDHTGWIWTVVLAAGGDRVISGGADRSVRVAPTRTGSLAGEICRRVSRNLTAEEWNEYLPGVAWEATCPDLPAASETAGTPQ